MTSWTLANALDYCGNCGVTIGLGKPMLKIALTGVKAVRHRCETCAKPYGAPNIAELEHARLQAEEQTERVALADTRTPAPSPRVSVVVAFARFSDVFDPRMAQAGRD